jgi:UDP-2-acetamido-2,6-beta-L-arabino-hexul-4-ose reductase
MIIGNGDIASILKDREGALFFASGVSNSSCFSLAEFNRERELLLQQPVDLCVFYFSTISIYTTQRAYTVHKIAMEKLIKERFENYNIIRIGNIDFGNNPNTFLNNLRSKKLNGEPIEIRDEYKYMISKEQLLLLTDNLPLKGKNEINVFGTMKKVIDLI